MKWIEFENVGNKQLNTIIPSQMMKGRISRKKKVENKQKAENQAEKQYTRNAIGKVVKTVD